MLALPLAAHGQSAKAGAPVDFTGYWVSVVTEDWRFRMVMPPKGDYASIPLNSEGVRAMNSWDPAKDESAGETCKAYGVVALYRMPGRLHITWEDDNTLRVDADAGTQTRMLRFAAKQPPSGMAPDWQGFSTALWEVVGPGPGTPGAGTPRDSQRKTGSLKVVTSNFKPGYLRRNGVPYSADAKLTEYYTRLVEANGDTWLVVTTIVDDPKYLDLQFITSSKFKKQADSTGWNPTACSAR
jgi:hypothetical protein